MKTTNNSIIKIIVLLTLLTGIYVVAFKSELITGNLESSQFASLAAFFYKNEKDMILNEAGKINESDNDSFWLNSGALFFIENNSGHTIQGDLAKYSPWRLVYRISNPLDTDDGYHPQNIFRLITKEIKGDISQSFYVLIVKDNLSESPNRNESNGIFSISRYQNSNTLYYAGIRVDGTAIIKKKKNGVYYTLSQIKVFDGNKYDKNTNPNLLPKNKWIGIKMNTKNKDSRTVEIELLLDENNTNNWTRVLSVLDQGQNKSLPILEDGYGGIRSDFMDIEIMNYSDETII